MPNTECLIVPLDLSPRVHFWMEKKKKLFACWGPVAFTKPKKEDWDGRALSAVVQLNPKKQSFVYQVVERPSIRHSLETLRKAPRQQWIPLPVTCPQRNSEKDVVISLQHPTTKFTVLFPRAQHQRAKPKETHQFLLHTYTQICKRNHFLCRTYIVKVMDMKWINTGC